MSKATIRIEQYKGTVGCTSNQKETLRGLGLRRIRHVVEREDTPATRGAVRHIPHLARILKDES